jgi:hypothetical protein
LPAARSDKLHLNVKAAARSDKLHLNVKPAARSDKLHLQLHHLLYRILSKYDKYVENRKAVIYAVM